MKINNKGNTAIIVTIIIFSVVILLAGAYGIFYLYQNYGKNKLPTTTIVNKVENIVIDKDKNIKVDVAKVEELDKELFTLINRDNFATIVNGKIVQKDKESIKGILNKLENNTNEFKKIKFNNTASNDIFCNSTRDNKVKFLFIDKIDEMFVNKGAFSSGTFLEFWFQQHPAEIAQYFRDYKRDCSALYEKNGIKLYEMK
jgi:hypothetical protein